MSPMQRCICLKDVAQRWKKKTGLACGTNAPSLHACTCSFYIWNIEQSVRRCSFVHKQKSSVKNVKMHHGHNEIFQLRSKLTLLDSQIALLMTSNSKPSFPYPGAHPAGSTRSSLLSIQLPVLSESSMTALESSTS